MIDKINFIKAMNCIKEADKKLDELYIKLEDSFINPEQLFNYIGISPLVSMLAEICGIDEYWLWIYTGDLNWGQYNGYVVNNTTGRKLPLKTLDDLYEVITYACPWDLEFKVGKM